MSDTGKAWPCNRVLLQGQVGSWPNKKDDTLAFVLQCEGEGGPFTVNVIAHESAQPLIPSSGRAPRYGGFRKGDEVLVVGRLVCEPGIVNLRTVLWRLLEQQGGMGADAIRAALHGIPDEVANLPGREPLVQLRADHVVVLKAAPDRERKDHRQPSRGRAGVTSRERGGQPSRGGAAGRSSRKRRRRTTKATAEETSAQEPTAPAPDAEPTVPASEESTAAPPAEPEPPAAKEEPPKKRRRRTAKATADEETLDEPSDAAPGD